MNMLFLECTKNLNLIFKNEVIFNQSFSGFEGAYILASDKVNCRQYWTQQNGNLAIWNDGMTINDWHLHLETNLGKAIGYMRGVGNYSACPINTEWQILNCNGGGGGGCIWSPSTDVSVVSADCQWSDWSPWFRCSATCGNGIRKRYRGKITKAISGGLECEGSYDESENCMIQTCPPSK